jgi:hypothetical protein
MSQIIIFIVRSLLKDYFNPLLSLIDYSIFKLETTTPSLFLYVFVISLAFVVSQLLIPQSIRFANRFQLVDHPNFRKTHLKSTPILGGVSIFFVVVFSFGTTMLFLYNQLEIDLNFKLIFGLFSAVALMVFFGLKDDILYLESDGRYTTIHLVDKSTLFVSKNIGEYEKLLSTSYFFRIHKKYLINLKYIININNSDGSNCELVGKLMLPVAKRRKEDLVSFLNIR